MKQQTKYTKLINETDFKALPSLKVSFQVSDINIEDKERYIEAIDKRLYRDKIVQDAMVLECELATGEV